MSQKKVLLAATSIFVFFLFFLEYTLKPQTDTDIPIGEVGGAQTAVSPTMTISPTITAPSPAATASSTPILTPPQRRTVTVTRVVDGDTVKIDSGETVRYIGMDTPETVDPRKPVQCFGNEASEKNKALVLGKTVELERDISVSDRYGRLLAYVWIGESMVNERLVREGYAFARTYPPDVRYQARLQEAERIARTEQKGLWGAGCASPSAILQKPL